MYILAQFNKKCWLDILNKIIYYLDIFYINLYIIIILNILINFDHIIFILINFSDFLKWIFEELKLKNKI